MRDESELRAYAFRPALTGFTERDPSWYVLRYRIDAERVLLRILRLIDIEYDLLTFEYRARHAGEATIRHWLPGYMFLRFDANADHWQQVMRAPGVIDILGDPTPVPDDVYYDLRQRCPREIVVYARTIIPIGSYVEVLEGPMRGQRGYVSGTNSDDVTIEMVVFARPTHVHIAAMNVMILRDDVT